MGGMGGHSVTVHFGPIEEDGSTVILRLTSDPANEFFS